MIHSREDYMHIQDNTGKIAEDEPVFLLKAKDSLAPDTVRHWAELLLNNDGDDVTYKAAMKHADLMEEWQREHGCKTPDTPHNKLRS